MTQSYIDQLTRHKVKLLCIKERCLFSEKGVIHFEHKNGRYAEMWKHYTEAIDLKVQTKVVQ